MTYEPGAVDERGSMWQDESGGRSRQSGSRGESSLEVEKREQERGEGGEGKKGEIPLFPAKKESHFKKSSQSQIVEGLPRSVKKYSENDFDRTNLILNSEKMTGKAKGRGGSDLPKLWASLSNCWGSNAQVRCSRI